MKTPILVAVALLCLPLAGNAQNPSPAGQALPPSHPPIGESPHGREAPSPWSELADYTLSVKVPPTGDSGTWKYRTFADAADMIVEFDTPGPKGRNRGTVMLVGGRALATSGFKPEPGFELDSLDVPILNLKILTQLLDAAVPGGPASLKGRQAVDASEAKVPILASTPTANARFNAPWSLKGEVTRIDANAVSFRLVLDVRGGEKTPTRETWTFTGEARGSPKGRVLDDAMNLAGWTAYRLGPGNSTKKSHATLKFSATRLAGPFATLKELRAALK